MGGLTKNYDTQYPNQVDQVSIAEHLSKINKQYDLSSDATAPSQ